MRYYGELDIDSLALWITRKVAVSNNRIPNHAYLIEKIKQNTLLAIFVAPKEKSESEFRAFLKCSRSLMHMQDIEFAYLFPEDFINSEANLVELL